MSIVIDDPEIERLARGLAAETGESVEQVVARLLREHGDVTKSRKRADAKELARRIRALQQEVQEHLVDDPRSDDEILGYDERGLPS